MIRRSAFVAGVTMLGLLCASTASARLGETLEQLTARFGKPVLSLSGNKVQPPVVRKYRFDKDGIAVWASFRDKKCEMIEYNGALGLKSFSAEDMDNLLKANGGPWIEEKKPTWDIVKDRHAEHMWRRQDNQVWAEKQGWSLTIMTFEWLEAEKAAKEQAKQKAAEAAKPKKLTGF